MQGLWCGRCTRTSHTVLLAGQTRVLEQVVGVEGINSKRGVVRQQRRPFFPPCPRAGQRANRLVDCARLLPCCLLAPAPAYDELTDMLRLSILFKYDRSSFPPRPYAPAVSCYLDMWNGFRLCRLFNRYYLPALFSRGGKTLTLSAAAGLALLGGFGLSGLTMGLEPQLAAPTDFYLQARLLFVSLLG